VLRRSFARTGVERNNDGLIYVDRKTGVTGIDLSSKEDVIMKTFRWFVVLSVAAFTASPALGQAQSGTIESAEGNTVVIKLADGKQFKASVSNSRTTITIKGQKGDRAALKAGMACSVDAPSDGGEAKTVTCN